MKQLSQNIVRLRWLIILIVTALTIFFGSQLSNLEIDADILKSLPKDDKDAVLLKEIGEKFGGNRMGVVILETDNIYKQSVIEHVKIITDSLNNINGISSISSLTNIINIKGEGFGIEIGNLVDEYNMPKTKEDFEILRQNVLNNKMYKGSIVSEDETATLIIFTLTDDADVNTVAKEVIEKSESLNLPEHIYYIGSPMLVTYISELMRNDLTTLLPIAFLVIAIVLLISFRSIKGVLLPLLTAVIAIIWSLGLMAVLGYNMSMISNNMPIILLAVGSAYAIHVINRIEQTTDTNHAVSIGLSFVLIPVLLAAITTSIGFVSFVFGAYLQMIIDFGIFTAAGTIFACLLAIFFVPSVLKIFNSKKLRSNTLVKKSALTPFLKWISALVIIYPKRIIGFWSLIIGVSITGIFFIERSVDIQEYFKPENPTRQAEAIMVDKFGGTKPVFVRFKGDMQSPEVLQKMWETASYMEQNENIYTTMSIAHLISELNYVISGERSIPTDADQIAQLWFLIDGNETLNRFVNEDLSEGIIISKFKSPENDEKIAFKNQMNAYIDANTTEGVKIDITGMPFVDTTMDRSLINSQLGSISIAIVFVILIVGLMLKSIKSGLLASIPIVAAIVLLFGTMGLFGISLNIATVLVASVALGIGIDYSIHIISHFNHEIKANSNSRMAIEKSILISGNAIIINVISVSSGFLVLIFSDMVPLQYFGILIATSMVSSSLGALTLLPAILVVLHKK
ncbi:MAG: hypothetical protein BM563_07660 [Bacteroidetes bacterium MedPE-SWsnd-G1]|nr:MAG: hypothetical protein BM563_07660 [Bacteroidetes bacterium MedPE-SWsnd-G1]